MQVKWTYWHRQTVVTAIAQNLQRFYYSKIVTHNSDDVEILKAINIDSYSVFVDKLVSSKLKNLFPL